MTMRHWQTFGLLPIQYHKRVLGFPELARCFSIPCVPKRTGHWTFWPSVGSICWRMNGASRRLQPVRRRCCWKATTPVVGFLRRIHHRHKFRPGLQLRCPPVRQFATESWWSHPIVLAIFCRSDWGSDVSF